jgi:hypothetical protein
MIMMLLNLIGVLFSVSGIEVQKKNGTVSEAALQWS